MAGPLHSSAQTAIPGPRLTIRGRRHWPAHHSEGTPDEKPAQGGPHTTTTLDWDSAIPDAHPEHMTHRACLTASGLILHWRAHDEARLEDLAEMASLSKSSSSMRPARQTLASSANSVCVVHCSEIGEKAGYDADEEAAKLFAATLLRGCPT